MHDAEDHLARDAGLLVAQGMRSRTPSTYIPIGSDPTEEALSGARKPGAGLCRHRQGPSLRGVSLLLFFNQGPVYESLWQSALEHHMQGRHQECVIFAQMAAEVASDACLSRLIARAEPVALRAWLETQIENTANLARQPVRRLLNALSGGKLEEEPWWSAYFENNRLRNEVAHRGRHVDGAQASRGLQAVRELITYLEEQAA